MRTHFWRIFSPFRGKCCSLWERRNKLTLTLQNWVVLFLPFERNDFKKFLPKWQPDLMNGGIENKLHCSSTRYNIQYEYCSGAQPNLVSQLIHKWRVCRIDYTSVGTGSMAGGEGEMTNGRKKVFNEELKFSRFGVITTRMEIGVH